MTVEYIDKLYRDRGIGCYMSTNHLLTSYMERGESHVKFEKRQAFSDVWGRMISAMMAFDSAVDKKLHLPFSGRWNLLRKSDCPDQTRHHEFEVREGRSQGFLCQSLGLKIHVC